MTSTIQELIVSYAPVIGLFLPGIQNYLNQFVEKDVKLFGIINMTAKSQKVFLSYFLAGLIAVIAVLMSSNWNIYALGITTAQLFALSQFAYYTYFRK